MQTGWQGNKTAMIEKGAEKHVARQDCVTAEMIKVSAEKVIKANTAFDKAREKGKEPDTARVDRAYAELHAYIERADKEGVK